MGLLSNIGQRISGILRGQSGPEQSRIAKVPSSLAPHPSVQTGRTEELLRSWAMYEGRIGPSAGPTKTRWAMWNADDLTPERIITAQRSAVTSGIPLPWV